MNWNELYRSDRQPDTTQIGEYVQCPHWDELCAYLTGTYRVSPKVEYSKCSFAPGWNVKYRKSSRSLCTLYPNEGYFTCLVSIGAREEVEAELLLCTCTDYVKELFRGVKPLNGARWLMVDVTSAAVLEDVKKLIALRAGPKG